jgi:hypothetical protein
VCFSHVPFARFSLSLVSLCRRDKFVAYTHPHALTVKNTCRGLSARIKAACLPLQGCDGCHVEPMVRPKNCGSISSLGEISFSLHVVETILHSPILLEYSSRSQKLIAYLHLMLGTYMELYLPSPVRFLGVVLKLYTGTNLLVIQPFFFFVRVPPDVICSQLCTSEVPGV